MGIDLANKMAKQSSENPFYGKSTLNQFLHDSAIDQTNKVGWFNQLDRTFKSLENKKDKELFYSIIFASGDIPNRQHDILRGKKIDQGGDGKRTNFRWAMEWLKGRNQEQYLKFVQSDIIRQFTNLENIIGGNVWTKKGTTQITEAWSALENVPLTAIAQYLASIINKSNDVQKALIAKWLVMPTTKQRIKLSRKTKEVVGKRPLQGPTVKRMRLLADLYVHLSEIMGWEYARKKGFIDFIGLKTWKKKYNSSLESVLFATKQINDLTETQFLELLNNLPAGARFRVRRRLLDADDTTKAKWNARFAKYFLAWEKSKEKAQETARVLTEKVRQGEATEEEKETLKTVKKEAKVSTGAESIGSMVEKYLLGEVSGKEADLLLHSILEKVKFEVPILVIADDSGSMDERRAQIRGKNFRGIDFARFLATMALLKNPSDEIDNILVKFGSAATVMTGIVDGKAKANRFVSGRDVKVVLTDRKKSFLENYNNISKLLNAQSGGTTFESVAIAFKYWIDSAPTEEEKQTMREMIQRYPVFLVISDGDMNSHSSQAQSMASFQQSMRQWFGWDGVVVVMDVNTSTDRNASKFAGLANVIHFTGWNLGAVNTLFTKLSDIEPIDIYTNLKAVYENNRYDIVRANVI